jgi:hypothetical protein
MATEKIIIGIDNETLNLTGTAEKTFIADREATNVQFKHCSKRSTKPSKMHAHQL